MGWIRADIPGNGVKVGAMKSPMSVAGVIFDLYHTLTGLESDWSEFPPTAHSLGIERRRWTELLVEQSRWRLIGEERDPRAVLRRLAHSIDPAIPEERIEAVTRQRIERFRHALHRIPEENLRTLQTLKERGFRLGLISNADVMEAAAWEGSPMAALFDMVLFSCDVGFAKPDREIYEHCLEALGLPAKHCVFVGDGGSGELPGARRAGLKTIFVSGIIEELWPEKVEDRIELADQHVKTIPEIIPLIVREN